MIKLGEQLDLFQKKIVHFVRIHLKLILLAILIGMIYFFYPMMNIVTPPYFKNNWIGMMIVVLILTTILVISRIYDIKFGKKKKKKVSKVIVVEKMTNNGFCDQKSEHLEKNCAQLLKKPCNTTDCCAWVKRTGKPEPECISGNADGPIFKTDEKGMKYKFDFYYFKEKKLPISKFM